MTEELAGKVAIVTGGGRGIGRSHCLALAVQGAAVVVNDVGAAVDGTSADRGPADEVVAAVRAAGGRAVASYADISLMRTGSELVTCALDTFGRLDILVNNAGALRPMPLIEFAEADWDAIVAVHLKGHFVTAQAAARVFVAQRSGRIVNTSSEAGLGMPLNSNYGAAKEGITGLTRSLALELAPYGVTVNQIRPRSSGTRMHDVAVAAGEKWGASHAVTLPGAAEKGLFSRPADFGPEHVSAFVTYLCSDTAHHITGQDFLVGGGEVLLLSKVRPVGTLDWTREDAPLMLAALAKVNDEHWSVPHA